MGASASILTLTATVVSIGKIAVSLTQKIQNAPAELNNVVVQLDIIREQLDCLAGIDRESPKDEICGDYQRTVKVGLDQSRLALLKVSNAIKSVEKRSDLNFRVRWAFFTRAQVKRLSQELTQAQQNLWLGYPDT